MTVLPETADRIRLTGPAATMFSTADPSRASCDGERRSYREALPFDELAGSSCVIPQLEAGGQLRPNANSAGNDPSVEQPLKPRLQ